MATIKVDSTAIREKANTFKTIATNINTYMQDMEAEINNMKGVWEGEASEVTINKFKEYKKGFEEKKQSIENYATFLESAAEAYDNSEESVKNSVQG